MQTVPEHRREICKDFPARITAGVAVKRFSDSFF